MLVTFHAAAVERWLEPELKLRQPVGDTQWVLGDVFPQGGGGVALSFRRGEAERLQLELRLRDDARPAARRTAKIDILHARDPMVGGADRGGEELSRVLSEVEAILGRLEPQTVFKPLDGVTSMDHDHGTAALNLAVPGDCGQACRFCSVRERVTLPHKQEEHALVADTLGRDIRRAAERGVRLLRINGIEPLNAPYLFDLLALAREVGYDEFHLLSTCRPLADKAFCARFLAAQPEKFRIYVPLYGSTAALHDAVTGAPGSFDDVMQAAENLRAVKPPGEVVFTTVLTRDNLDDVVAMRDVARGRCKWWEVHLPFPNSSSQDDRFRASTVSMTEALGAVYRERWWPLADLQLGEVLPCVALRHQQASGHGLITTQRLRMRTMELAGTFYAGAGFAHSYGSERDSAFISATVACPHAEGCALAPVCPKKTYALYAEVHGLEELAPVRREQLEGLEDARRILEVIDDGEA